MDWIPQVGVIKVNWDVVIDSSNKKIDSVGTIVRDQQGNVLASLCSSKPYIIDLAVAEAYTTEKVVDRSLVEI
jgi:hypothetical protein